jgi:hypothetical protein
MIEQYVVEIDGWFAITDGNKVSMARHKNRADAEAVKDKPFVHTFDKKRTDIKSVSQMMKEMKMARLAVAQEFIANPFNCKGVRTGRAERRAARNALKVAKREHKKRQRQQLQVQE